MPSSEEIKLEKGHFVKRINRFTVKCKINGRTDLAYLPNPGRLYEILLPGKVVYLGENTSGNFSYTVWAAEKNGEIILLHTHFTNRVAEKLIEGGVIPSLRGYRIKKREVKLENCRIDFLVEKNGHLMPLEVKSCTFFHMGFAMFPDAVTRRGKEHLEVLAAHGGMVLFVVHSPSVEYFLPNFHIDFSFSETLYRLRKSLMISAVAIKWNREMNFEFVRELKIPWEIYEKEAVDKGAYLLVGKLREERKLHVGGMGEVRMKEGYYIYVGSGMGSLTGRVRRHMRKRKRKRWHIDYLIPYLVEPKVFLFRSSRPLECLISKELEKISEPVENFGASDCRCKSHLYRMEESPLTTENFIEIFLNFQVKNLPGEDFKQVRKNSSEDGTGGECGNPCKYDVKSYTPSYRRKFF